MGGNGYGGGGNGYRGGGGMTKGKNFMGGNGKNGMGGNGYGREMTRRLLWTSPSLAINSRYRLP